MTWRAILDDETRDRAIAAVRDVAVSLRSPPAGLGADLAEGAAGIAVFYDHVARAEIGVADAQELAAAYLERAIDAVAAAPMSSALHGGFTGIAWAAQHLHGDDAGEALDEIDAMLLELVEHPLHPFDLVEGAAGAGVYAVEREHRALLEAIVRRLDETATRTDDGAAWHTQLAWVPEHLRAAWPDGYFNLGMAHGVPAVIAVLAQAAARGIPRAEAACRDAIRWLLALARADGESAFAPRCAVDLERGRAAPSPLAWCYGDVGIAAALATAAAALDDAALLGDAVRIARRAAPRSGFRDCGLCHGSAGVALMFQRLYHATDDAVLADAARCWVRTTLDHFDPDAGDRGLLLGAAGVALSLLAASTPHEPAWDRSLALSARRRQSP